jgi:hypothetical protein
MPADRVLIDSNGDFRLRGYEYHAGSGFANHFARARELHFPRHYILISYGHLLRLCRPIDNAIHATATERRHAA